MTKKTKILITVILAVIVGGGIFVYQYRWMPKREIKIQSLQKIKECERIEDDFKKYDCFQKLAISTKDASICGLIESDYMSFECFKEIGISTKDLSLCKKINREYKSLRANCITGIAKNLKNITICEEIDFINGWPENCYSSVGAMVKDPSICKETKEIHYRDHCLTGVAVGLKDSSLCERIQIDSIRDYCLERVETVD